MSDPQPGPSDEEGLDANVEQSPYHMTEDVLKKRAHSESGGRYSRQLYAGIVASVSSVSFGTVLGWSSPAIRHTIEDTTQSLSIMDEADVDLGTIASLAPLGCSIGVVVWSYFNNKIGPKKTMVLQSPILFITWIMIALSRTLHIALFGRFLCGFLAISYRVCGETLLLDAVHRVHLRRMVISFRSCVYVGILISYVCGFVLKDKYFSILNCVIVAVHFIMLLLCPESPVYLYDVNVKQAEEALSWYRGKQNAYVDMRNIKHDSEIRKVDPVAYKYMMRSKVVIKATIVVIGVNTINVLSGYCIFLYYNPAMVRKLADDRVNTIKFAQLDSKIDVISRNWDAIFLAVNMLVASVISTWCHYSVFVGVKKPLIASCACVGIVLALLASYHYLRNAKVQYIIKNNWTYDILVHLLVISYEIGLSSCGEIMLLDYVPSQVYPRAKRIVAFSQWMLTFILTRLFFGITNILGGAYTWTMFSLIVLCGLVFVHFFVVESKGKTLVKIQTALGGNPIGTRGYANKLFMRGDQRQPIAFT